MKTTEYQQEQLLSHPLALRRSTLHALALLCAAALLPHAVFAAKPGPPPPPSSGTLVLAYSYPGADSTENWGLTVAPSGSIYASGITFPGYRALILGSGNSGSSWSLLDDFRPTGRQVDYWDQCGGIASDPAGNLFATGLTEDDAANEPDQWYVRRSTDAGMTWTTTDDFVVTGGWPDDVTGIAVDAAGDVYVSGWTPEVWMIRKGVGGTSFSTVDSVANGYPNAVFAHPTAGVFAVGRRTVVIKSNSSYVWVVRRSTNGGATWSDVDTFQLSTGHSSHANGIGADALGNLYIVGRGITTSRGNNIYHWVVRKSTDGGNSWSTVDDFVASSNSAEARRFVATSNGDLYVAGIATTSTGTHWIVRKNPGGTGGWTTIDDYQYAPGVSTEPHAIVADSLGNLFVGGTGGGLWLIKKY